MLPFTNLYAEFDRDASPRFRSLRLAARERFASTPLPTTRTEDWRFTNIAPMVETNFTLPGELSIDDPAAIRDDLTRLFFVNGRFASVLSSPGQGSTLGDGDISALGQIVDLRDNPFAALNTAFLADGAVITVPDGTAISKPIEIVYLSATQGKSSVTHPRTLITVGRNAQVTVVERYLGHGNYFSNAVTEIAVGEGAVVDHVKVQSESDSAYHIATTQIVMAAKANFTTHNLSLGGALVRNEVRVRFDGEHAEATVNGLYLANANRHVDNFTVIDHAKPNCASHEVYKGVLADRAHGVFNGKIFVRKDAQKTDAKQTNKVLLLSDDATINTKPQLEIFADDVKCTHGATIGQLDATQMFYLRSRGIPLEQARRLLTFAFANDIVNRVKIESIRAELEDRIV